MARINYRLPETPRKINHIETNKAALLSMGKKEKSWSPKTKFKKLDMLEQVTASKNEKYDVMSKSFEDTKGNISKIMYTCRDNQGVFKGEQAHLEGYAGFIAHYWYRLHKLHNQRMGFVEILDYYREQQENAINHDATRK